LLEILVFAVYLHNYICAGAYGFFEVTHDITRYCKAKIFEHIGKKTPLFIRFSTVGELMFYLMAQYVISIFVAKLS